MLINERTIKEINLVSQQCFWLNRVVDRAVSVLGVKFGMPITSKILHQGLAHKYPLLADSVNEILDMYNELVDYLDTPADTRDYEDIVELFQTILDENIKLYDMTRSAIFVSRETRDVNVETHLLDFLEDINEYIAQTITLRDKAVSLKDNVEMYELLIDKIFTLS